MDLKIRFFIFIGVGLYPSFLFAIPKCNVNSEVDQQYVTAKESLKSNSLDSIEKIRQVAFQGHAVAAHELGFYYVKGQYVVKNYRLAYQWFKIGATRGQHNSMFSLAIMNRKGEGRPVSLSAAYAWYRLAGKFIPVKVKNYSVPESKLKLYRGAAKKIEKLMNPSQLLRGKQLMQIYEKDIICSWYGNH